MDRNKLTTDPSHDTGRSAGELSPEELLFSLPPRSCIPLEDLMHSTRPIGARNQLQSGGPVRSVGHLLWNSVSAPTALFSRVATHRELGPVVHASHVEFR